MLTQKQKQDILILCGASGATAENASCSAGEFLAHLEAYGCFSRDNLNPKLWQDYPGILALIREATRVPFEKLAYAIADNFNEQRIEDFCGRYLSPPLQPREISFIQHNTLGVARALFQEAYRKDNDLTIAGLARGFRECGYTECLRLLEDNGYCPKMDAPTARPFLEEKQGGEEMDPLAATLRQQQQQNMTTQTFLNDTSNHYRNALLTAMDDKGAWKALLAQRGLLNGPQMEAWVSKLSREWTETRSNNPSWQVLSGLLRNDPDFARGSLEQLASALAGTGVDDAVASMVSFYLTKKDTQTAKSNEAFSAQNSLRAWLVPSICDEGDADALVQKLRLEGVREPKDLCGMDKGDLFDLGFNKRQAISAANKIKAEFK
jgi:hypothetical protein